MSNGISLDRLPAQFNVEDLQEKIARLQGQSDSINALPNVQMVKNSWEEQERIANQGYKHFPSVEEEVSDAGYEDILDPAVRFLSEQFGNMFESGQTAINKLIEDFQDPSSALNVHAGAVGNTALDMALLPTDALFGHTPISKMLPGGGPTGKNEAINTLIRKLGGQVDEEQWYNPEGVTYARDLEQ